MKMIERKMESYMYAILSISSLVKISKCQILLTKSCEKLKEGNRETDLLRAINVRLQEEIRKKDARLQEEIRKKDARFEILEGEVSKLQSRIASLEINKKSTLSKVSVIEQWISGQKTAYKRRVRLVNGGSSYGRLEVYIAGYGWGSVCDDRFNSTDATVVCRQLGYTTGVAKIDNEYGQGTLDIVMDDVDCGGFENAIHNCRFVGKDRQNCEHYEDVGVSCS